MLKSTSKNFRRSFLIKFTTELLKHSLKNEFTQLKEVVKEESIGKPVETKISPFRIQRRIQKPFSNFISTSFSQKQISPRPSIVEPMFPPRLQYLKPVPTNVQIDLDKLNPLVKDPMINIIECEGAKKNIIVSGRAGKKFTKIFLTEEEVNKVIKNFSEVSKIPTSEGVFRVAVGKLVLSAIISEVVGSKFIIKKMNYNPSFQ
ncbi:MAG: hypothetical protein KKF68_02310 [Nanoarchaeota archaeon]|nr:hypothetical protein [Nanoarchaeota archaeon]